MNNNNYTKKIYDKESNSWRYYNDENQLHRLDGYAIESDDPEYYINGEEIEYYDYNPVYSEKIINDCFDQMANIKKHAAKVITYWLEINSKDFYSVGALDDIKLEPMWLCLIDRWRDETSYIDYPIEWLFQPDYKTFLNDEFARQKLEKEAAEKAKEEQAKIKAKENKIAREKEERALLEALKKKYKGK